MVVGNPNLSVSSSNIGEKAMLSFIVGLFIGTFVGVFALGLCAVSRCDRCEFRPPMDINKRTPNGCGSVPDRVADACRVSRVSYEGAWRPKNRRGENGAER